VKLAEDNCKALGAGDKPLPPAETQELIKEIDHWTLGDKSIEREFKFRDFKQSMDFINQVADLAEKQNHHPDILISYSRVKLMLSTHKVGGLSRNDFILAAKIDQLI
jgi:4a-hydroxytetrahydrobiopterin dehydratase